MKAGILMLGLAYMLSQFYRAFLAVLAPALKLDLGMSATDLSWASGIWFLSFSLMQFPVGVWLDSFGPRRTTAALLALGGAGGAAVFALADGAGMVILAMAMIGIGCSSVLMSSFFIFARQFDAVRFATLSSTLVGVASLGNVLGTEPLARAAEAFGWRTCLWGLAAITLAVAVGIATVVRDPPREEGATTGGGYLTLLRLPALWPIFALMLVSYAGAASVRGLWVGPYFADLHGYTGVALGRASFLMALGMCVGAILYGPLDRLLNSRKWVALPGNLVVVACFALLAVSLPHPMLAMWVFGLIGLFGMSYGVIMAHGKAFFPPGLTGRGVTLLNFFSIGGAGLMQFLSGGVYRLAADPAQPAAGYQGLFTFYAVITLLACLYYLTSRDVKPRG